MEEAKRIVQRGDRDGIPLRLLGSVAVRYHSPGSEHLYANLNRPLTDIDLITYGKFGGRIVRIMNELGYRADQATLALFGGSRQIYESNSSLLHVDVFLDRLSFSHVLELKDRLEVDSPTIPLADILLEKTQIVQINEKDLKDSAILLREHEVGNRDADTINGRHVAKVLANDWGFHYTATMNLHKLENFVRDFSLFNLEERRMISDRIAKLLDMIDREPKPTKWKLRAKVGTSRKWYADVENVSRWPSVR